MNKVIRDGEVAVLVSGGYGAGWSTWNYEFPECLFDPEIVELIEQEKSPQEIADFALQKYGENFYTGGADGLYVYWVPQGSEFLIDEYDGSESLQLKEEMSWTVA